jgi:hypothetical protein
MAICVSRRWPGGMRELAHVEQKILRSWREIGGPDGTPHHFKRPKDRGPQPDQALRHEVSLELRRLFTRRMNAYRLIVGAVVLAIVIPAWAAGVQAMWLVAVACVLVVIGAVVAGTRVSSIREWLGH